MKQYLDSLKHILDHGEPRDDRTGAGTMGVFGMQTRYDLKQSFPCVTTKKLAWRSMVGELLWMIEGSGDERRLAEITHGTRDGVTTIWTANALAPYWKSKARFTGDLGRVYGVQWRHWQSGHTVKSGSFKDEFGNYKSFGDTASLVETDQLSELIQGLRRDPYSRRHLLTSWNPGELDSMALPPCHVMAQFYVHKDRGLSCQMYQRSADMFLGVPFNIASYSLLTHMIAQVCELEVDEFIHVIGDAHIYMDHIDQVKEQLDREPYDGPELWLNPSIRDITKFAMDDIKLLNYVSHEAITGKMAV